MAKCLISDTFSYMFSWPLLSMEAALFIKLYLTNKVRNHDKLMWSSEGVHISESDSENNNC